MKRIFLICFANWWRSLFLVILGVIAVLLSYNYFGKYPLVISLIFLFTGIFSLGISTIYIIIKKRWVKRALLVTFLISVFIVLLYFMQLEILKMFQPDNFATNLVIPDNIHLNVPKSERFLENDSSAINTFLPTKLDFEIYKTELSGIYGLQIWIGKVEAGSVYLKAYEVTQEFLLSESHLRKVGLKIIENKSDSIKSYGPVFFTISEGDWGQFYAARFEVWYEVEDGETERKLIEKIYKIEGYSN